MVKQASFHAHFEDDKHGVSDWEIILIDHAENVYDLKRKQPFWQYELDPFQTYGLDERDETLI